MANKATNKFKEAVESTEEVKNGYCEVHSAETSEVTKMTEKLAWLKQWLKDKGPAINALPTCTPKYVWLSSGRVNVLPTSREAKKISHLGIVLTSHLNLK